MMKAVVLVLCCALAACSSDDGDGKTKTQDANPCATPGATYLQMTTKLDGTCPEIPDQIINIGGDGTLASPVMCDRIEQDGCTARNTNCVNMTDECKVTSTFATTFKEDGSSASGLITMSIECKDGSSCVGTYEMLATRQ